MKRALFVALLLLQLGDALTTRAALAHGAVELNPLVRLIGLWPAKLAVCAGIVLLASRCRVRVLVGLCAVYGAIVVSNARLGLR